jgi:hypothetical protein
MFEIRRLVLPVAAMLMLMSGLTAAAQTATPARRVPAPDRRLRPAPTTLGQTWVRTGFFNEIDQNQRTATTINQPAILRFIWGTTLKSEEGFWRLRRRVAGTQFSLVATGTATNGTGGRFDIDLGPYLSTTPPIEPAVYHLEVVARAKSKADQSTTTGVGQIGGKVAAQELGPWSAPVVITYAVSTAPSTSFDIGDVYRRVTFVLDKITVVADQDGPGEEEYWAAGFVQELQRSCSAADCPFTTPLAQRRFGPFRRDLNPPDEAPFGWTFNPARKPPIQKVSNAYDFPLGSGTNRVTGQRRFAVAISLIEEDAGSSIDDWNTAVTRLSDVVEDGQILGFDKDDVTEYLSDHAADAIRYVADGVRLLSTIADIGVAAPIVGTAVAVATFVIVPVIQDMADDYYGTGAAHLTLESNLATEIHKLSGRQVGSGATGRYVLRSQRLRFKGPPASNAASAFDGVVDIEFHWEFSERAQQ